MNALLVDEARVEYVFAEGLASCSNRPPDAPDDAAGAAPDGKLARGL
jgi:hypothetical protein